MRPKCLLGFANNLGDVLTFKILKNDLITAIHKSVVRSEIDPNHQNNQISFKSDIQEKIKKLDKIPSNDVKTSHSKHNYRNVQ
jgi:hypothetical protein